MCSKIGAIIGLVSLSFFVKGQTNLVPNGSFEALDSCITGWNELDHATPWFQPVVCFGYPGGSSDIWNNCSPNPAYSTPNNHAGYQSPRTGNGYCGISTFQLLTPNMYGEYIEVKLSNPLNPLKKYRVSFFASLAINSQAYVGATGLSAYLSQDSLLICSDSSIILQPQIYSSLTNPIMDTTNWVEISGEYFSQGGEQFLTIGNFFDFNSIIWDSTGLPQNPNYTNKIAYYFIDDVSVLEVDTNVGIKETQMSSIKLYPNPTSQDVTFEYNSAETSIYEIQLSDIAGRQLISQKLKNQEGKVNFSTTELSSGIYLFSFKENNRIKYQTKLCVLK